MQKSNQLIPVSGEARGGGDGGDDNHPAAVLVRWGHTKASGCRWDADGRQIRMRAARVRGPTTPSRFCLWPPGHLGTAATPAPHRGKYGEEGDSPLPSPTRASRRKFSHSRLPARWDPAPGLQRCPQLWSGAQVGSGAHGSQRERNRGLCGWSPGFHLRLLLTAPYPASA